MDVAPTLLDYAGCKIPSDIQGLSLKPLLENKNSKLRDTLYYHYYGARPRIAPPEMFGVRTKTHKLIHYPEGVGCRWELFDLTKDPHEMHNLYSNPEHHTLKTELKNKLQQQIDLHEDTVSFQ